MKYAYKYEQGAAVLLIILSAFLDVKVKPPV